jgi:hydrogenase/urease accessory protein HupE
MKTLITLTLALALAAPAAAHKVGLSKVELLVDDADVELTVALAKDELTPSFPAVPVALTGCALEPAGVSEVDDGDGAGVAMRFEGTCQTGTTPTLELNYLNEVSFGHRAIVVAKSDGWHADAVLTRGTSSMTLGHEVGAPVLDFIGIGVEHILIGADHLLFLFGLVLIRARGKDLLALVSAFTLAHSITLSAAALGWLALPGSVVEPIIALSVAYVGIENFFKPEMRNRWRLTFAFGLIHGFGFAGVLGEIGLPSESAGLALVLFNVGVELGQLLVLAALLPVLIWLRRRPAFEALGVPALNALVVVIGLFWFIERVL